MGTSSPWVLLKQSEMQHRTGVKVRIGFSTQAHSEGGVRAAWLGWRMQLVHSSLPVHPPDNPIYIPFSSPGSCCYHGNYVHSCYSLASGKTHFSFSPLVSFPFSILDTWSCGCQSMGKLARLLITGIKAVVRERKYGKTVRY